MSKQTRREFLEQSMLSAAAAALAGSTAAPGRHAFAGSKSPNERLRVAVIGVRGRGGGHVSEYLRRQDVEIAAIVDVDESFGLRRVESIAKSSGKKPAFYQDMRKVMDDTSIDCVSIATPNHWHALASIWAIQSGKDVYVEKPVSHNVSEGRRIVQAARKHEKIVQTGTQVRSSQGVRDAIGYIHDGKLGEVRLARGLCYKRRPSIGTRGFYDVPAGVDYGLWLGPAPEKPLTRPRLHYDWHWVWDTGNGDLGNQGIHQMDICRWGLGVHGLGTSVLSYGGRLGYIDAGETANTQVSIHDYGDKRLVFEVRGLKTERNVGCVFYGTEGTLVISSYTGAVVFDNDGEIVEKFSGGGDHFGNFLAAVRSRKRSDLNAEILDGHYSSALCHLGNISYRLGTKVTASDAESRLRGDKETHETFQRVADHLAANEVDLKATKLQFGPHLTLNSKDEVFTGDWARAANQMLTRDYRKPFIVPAEKDV